MNEALYVFLDESGNLDFSVSGTRFFALTGVSMRRPFRLNETLDSYKYDLLEQGVEQEYFHCSEDNPRVRGHVFDIISNGLAGIHVDSVIVEKSKTEPALRADGRFYPQMLGHLLGDLLARSSHPDTDEVIIITDSLPVQKRRRAVEKAIKVTLANMLPEGTRYRIAHHDSRSHYGLQIADYCCWAVFRKHERGDETAYNRINSAIRTESDIFRDGTRRYY